MPSRVWYGAGEASNALTLLLFALLARLLGVEPYGELIAIIASTAILGTLAEFGFHTLLARAVARSPSAAWADLMAALRRQLWIGPLMLAALYAYMQWADLSRSSYPAGMLVGLSVWCRSLKESLRGVSRGLSRFDVEALFLWTERLGLLVLSLAAIALGGGLTAIGAVFLGVRALDLLAFFIVVRRVTRRVVDRSGAAPRTVRWLAAWPFAMSNLLLMLYYQVDVSMLAALGTSREAGLYGALYRFIDALQVIPRLVIVVAFPAMAVAWAADRIQFRHTLHRLQRALLLIGVPIVLVVFLWSERLLVLAFGPEFAEGATALRLLVLGNLFAFQSLLLAQAMQTSAHERTLAWILTATVVVNIVLNAILIPDRGVSGAAEAKAMTEVLYLALLGIVSFRSFTGDVGLSAEPARPRRMSRSNEEPLRVLLACDRLGHDNGGLHGAGRCMIEWSRGLLARGVDVTPVILRAPPALQAVTEREGLPFVFLQRSSFDARTVLDFLGLIDRRGIQVLHLQGHGSSTFGRLAARRARRPAIVHVHADYRLSPKGYPWYVRTADRALAPSTALALTVTEQLIPFMVEDQGFRREQIEVLRNPVDLGRFRLATGPERLEARATLGLAPDAFVVTALGRLDRLKGIDVLLEAWQAVARNRDTAVLLLAGEGPERPSLQRMVERLRLPRVRFLGQQGDVRRVIWGSDVLAMPSRYEAMPMAALEALACGVPVVASRVGGIPEIVCDGENGLLVPVEDANDLAQALAAVTDEARRRSLSAGALRLIEPYGLTSFVAALEGRYVALAEGGATGVPAGLRPVV